MKLTVAFAAFAAAVTMAACSEKTVVEDTPDAVVAPPAAIEPAPAPMDNPAAVPPLNDPTVPTDPSLPPAETPATPPMPPTTDPVTPPPG